MDSKNFILEATPSKYFDIIRNWQSQKEPEIPYRDVNPIYVAADSCHK